MAGRGPPAPWGRPGPTAQQPPCHRISAVPGEGRPGGGTGLSLGSTSLFCPVLPGDMRRKFPCPSQRPGKQMGPVEPPGWGRGRGGGGEEGLGRAGPGWRGSEAAPGIQDPRRPAPISGKAATWRRELLPRM